MTGFAPPRRRRLRPVRLWWDEAGAGSAFGLFGILICLMFAGVSIDFTNAWRNREILRLSADVAAHAGASALAQAGVVVEQAIGVAAVAVEREAFDQGGLTALRGVQGHLHARCGAAVHGVQNVCAQSHGVLACLEWGSKKGVLARL
jgi:hypothetical protein